MSQLAERFTTADLQQHAIQDGILPPDPVRTELIISQIREHILSSITSQREGPGVANGVQILPTDIMRWVDFVKGHPRFVTNDPFRWADIFFNSTSAILNKLPEHIEITFRNIPQGDIETLHPQAQVLYQNAFVQLQNCPCSFADEYDLPIPLEALMSWYKLNVQADIDALRGVVDAQVSPFLLIRGTSWEDLDSSPVPFMFPTLRGYTIESTGEGNFLQSYFHRVKMYMVMNSRNIKNKELKNHMQSFILDKSTLCPQARVVDNSFFNNQANTNRSKMSKLVKWFLFLKDRLNLLDHNWSVLNTRAWRVSSIFTLIERGFFRNFFFPAFAEFSTNDANTDDQYFSVITEISKAMHVYELSEKTLVAPKSVLSKIRHAKNLNKKTVAQASTHVPLNLWLTFVMELFYSENEEQHCFAILCLINFLTVSRFSEFFSLHWSQINVQLRTPNEYKTVRVLPIKLQHSKVGKQEYEIPICPIWKLLDLEILLQYLKIFVKPNHLSIKELTIPSLSPLTNAKFNQKLQKYWTQFISQPGHFFDPRGTKFTSHTLRKLSAVFYLDILDLDINYVRILYGHKETSQTLEKVYLTKSRPQLVQEAYWAQKL